MMEFGPVSETRVLLLNMRQHVKSSNQVTQITGYQHQTHLEMNYIKGSGTLNIISACFGISVAVM